MGGGELGHGVCRGSSERVFRSTDLDHRVCVCVCVFDVVDLAVNLEDDEEVIMYMYFLIGKHYNTTITHTQQGKHTHSSEAPLPTLVKTETDIEVTGPYQHNWHRECQQHWSAINEQPGYTTTIITEAAKEASWTYRGINTQNPHNLL